VDEEAGTLWIMLLNEFLKEHRKMQKLEAALAAMDRRLKAGTRKLKASRRGRKTIGQQK
jgi:hypothetical protein